MSAILNATDVRKNWGQFNDDVVREGPRFVKRSRDKWAALSTEHLRAALADYRFDAIFYQEEDGTVTAALDGFDIVENGDNKEEAIELMTDELIEYALEYQENFNLYYNSSNRHKHFPYIMHVLVQEDAEEVRCLINA